MDALQERRTYLLAIACLIVLRFIAGAVLPLSADEAYYWLWSKHLAAGYYDHPPAIAFLIRAGVSVFGDTSLGVRFLSLLLSVAASWFVWRAGALTLNDERAGLLACLLFNLTPMIAVETMAATPDAPLIACSAAFLFALAKIDDTQNGRWWLAVGVTGGLALLSKYTGFFLGIGALAWIVFTPQARRWLLSPWPYLGALLALMIFTPNLWWNATHRWMTFAFQFGRVGTGRFTWRFLAEFLGAQLLLATPVIFLCGAVGLRHRRGDTALLAAIVLPAVVYFALHSLHDRVQGNWPCFLYPALAVAAASAMRGDWNGYLSAWAARLAIPVAGVLLALCYLQAFFAVLPIGRSDPFARLLGFGVTDVMRMVESKGAPAILTTDYESTSWFAFYGHLPVVQLNEDYRRLVAPRSDVDSFKQPVLYVTNPKRDRHDLVASRFRRVVPLGSVDRMRNGVPVERYLIYSVSGMRGRAVGGVP